MENALTEDLRIQELRGPRGSFILEEVDVGAVEIVEPVDRGFEAIDILHHAMRQLEMNGSRSGG